MLAISLALGNSPMPVVAQTSLNEVVVIPWSAKDRTFLCAGPVNTFRSGIFLVDGNCEILLDDKKVNITDVKSPMVGELTYSDPTKFRSGNIPAPNGMKLRSIWFDPLLKDEHRASLPSVSNGIKPNEKDIEVTDYNNMEFRKPGPKAWGSVPANWHARAHSGILKSATDKQIVIAPWNPLAGRRPDPKPFTVPVTRVVNIVSSEYTRRKARTGGGDVGFGGVNYQAFDDPSHPTETYYYNPVTRVLESSLHRDAYLLGAAPAEDVEECKRICEHFDKDWATISGAERVWAFRLLQYGRAQKAQRAEDRKGWKNIAVLGTIVWLASIAPSVPSIALPSSPDDKKAKSTEKDSTVGTPKPVKPEIIVTGRIKGVPKGTEVVYETFFLPPLPANASVFTKDDKGTFEIRLKEPGSLQILVKGKLRWDRNVTKSIDIGDQ